MDVFIKEEEVWDDSLDDTDVGPDIRDDDDDHEVCLFTQHLISEL